MKRALVALVVVLGLGLSSGAWANRVAKQPGAKAKAGERTRASRPETARAAILHSMRSRGIIKPAKRLFANSGIAGGPTLIFSEQNVARRVTRKGSKPGQTEVVNVRGRAVPSAKNKSGWSVHMEIAPVAPPAQNAGR
jgi:hypothetical protein